MDPKVGGKYKMSFTNFTTGQGHSFGGEYRELVPFEKHSSTRIASTIRTCPEKCGRR